MPPKKEAKPVDTKKQDELMYLRYVAFIKGHPIQGVKKPKKPKKPKGKAKKPETRMDIWSRTKKTLEASRERSFNNVNNSISLREKCFHASKYDMHPLFIPVEPPEPPKKPKIFDLLTNPRNGMRVLRPARKPPLPHFN